MGYTLHVHTAGGGKGYTLHVHAAGSGRGYTLQVYAAGGERDTPGMSILLAVERVTCCTRPYCRSRW
jgi:hypothetical protein